MKRLLLLLFLIGIPGVAASQSLEKYYVSGTSTQELSASIKRLGPRDATGSTLISWEYSYSHHRSNRISRAVNPVVTRDLKFRMPYWAGYHSGSACLQRSWSAMYASLSRHEIKHALISDGVKEKVEKAILSVGPQRSGANLERAVKRAVDKVFRAHSAAQKKFDRDTKHGAEDPADPIVFKNCS